MCNTDDGPRAPRNLVVCCDGTGNIWGNTADTNVVKLVRLCLKGPEQLVFYDPGVGTANAFPAVGLAEDLYFKLKLAVGLAFGSGIYENIAQAYAFLVDNYRAGDRVYLFGFSRGAFTVRSVSGLVSLFGLVRPSALSLLPLLLRTYFSTPGAHRERVAHDIRSHFTDDVGAAADIHLIGVWDTVSTVGGVFGRRTITSDPGVTGKPFRHVRHALAAGEYRSAYAPRYYVPPAPDAPPSRGGYVPTLKQVWFPGSHSDVGGSYAESGLSDLALRWMVDESVAVGLRLAPAARLPTGDVRERAHDQALHFPGWAIAGLERRVLPQPGDVLHESLIRRAPGKGALGPARGRGVAWALGAGLATGAAYALVAAHSARITPGSTSAAGLAALQLSAPFADQAARAPYRDVGAALAADLLLIASYAALGCALSVFAVRMARPIRPHDGRFHGALRSLFQRGLTLAVLCDVLENALTWGWLAADVQALAWPLAGLCLGKWLALATLTLTLLALCALRLGVRRAA